MTEIADIGFRVNTADLEKGTTGLKKMSAAAAGIQQLNLTIGNMSKQMSAFARSMAQVESLRAQQILSTTRARKNATVEEIKAAENLARYSRAAAAAAREDMNRVNQLKQVVIQNNEVARSASKAALAVASTRPTNRVGGIVSGGRVSAAPLARDQMPNRFNTANIAAQFQDIGVTAAMGMNPMTIALQQGTQLSAIMNSMESPLKGIAQAFRSVFNATSLLTIGIVAAVAALIQFTDWTKAGQSVLNGLADAAEAAVPAILILGTALAILYAPAIYAGLLSIGAAFYGMAIAATAAAVSAVSAFLAISLPIGLLVGEVLALAAIFQVMGFDVLGILKKVGNGIIGVFVGAFNTVKATWKMLPAVMGDIVIKMANLVLGKIEAMINGSIELINSFISKIPDRFRPDGALIEWKAKVKIDNPFEGMGDKVDKMAEDEFSKAMNKDYIGSAGKWVGDKLRGAASSIGAAASGKDKKEKKDPWEELVGDASRKISVLKAEQAAIGMTEQAAARLRYETELLNEAQQKGIKLDEEKRTKIGELAAGMAETEAETARLKNAYQFLEDAGRGFISDLRSNLQEGKSLWESFGASVKNVIDKMIEEILNSQIKSVMQSIIPSGGGGLLGGLAGILGGAFGGGGIESSIASSIAANPSIFAKGGAFNNGLIPFAKGGAFTNGIVNRATPFAFADGGAFGVMGEAGPEAVMPLHRGPDGSLGVRMNGAASNDNAAPQQNVTYVINAPGASKSDLESVKQTLMAMAGPGVTEQRVQIAQSRGVL
jgi:hypothetical protein